MAEIVSYRNVFPGNLLPEKRMLHQVRRSILSCCSKNWIKTGRAMLFGKTIHLRPDLSPNPSLPVVPALNASILSSRITRGFFSLSKPRSTLLRPQCSPGSLPRNQFV
jgi:hypothetical protein